MAKYKVTHGFIQLGHDEFKGVGEIVELDEEKGDAIVESGCAEKIVEKAKAPEAPKK